MMKMTKKTIMLSAVALIAANALTFGPVSYKVSAADSTVVTKVSKYTQLNSVYTQLNNDSVLRPLVSNAFNEAKTYANKGTFDVAALLPNLWLEISLDPADKTTFKNELTKVIRFALVELDPTNAPVSGISTDLEQSLTALSEILVSNGYPSVNKTQLSAFVSELEAAALAKINGMDLASIVNLGELLSTELDVLIKDRWDHSSSEVVKLLKALYQGDLDLLLEDVKTAKDILNADAFTPGTAKQATAALGLAYVKAQLVGKTPLGSPLRVDANNYKITQFNILGASAVPFSAFNFEAENVTFAINADGHLQATTASAVTSSRDVVITATLKSGAPVPSYLNNATVFTQTVTLSPADGGTGGGGGPIVDDKINQAPNADAIANGISNKLDAALEVIGELKTNQDISALVAIVEAELKSALTFDLTSNVKTANGLAEVKLSAADFVNVLADLDSVVKKANAALQEVLPDADPVHAVLNLSTGNHNDMKISLDGDLIDALNAKGIYAIGVMSNGVQIEIPLSELGGNTVLQITKVANAAPQLNASAKQISDVFSITVADAKGNEKHEFDTPIRLTLPVNSVAIGQERFLTMGRVDGDQLVNVGGRYNPATKQVSKVKNSLSSYVVIENSVSFKDASELAWAEDDILTAAAKGVILGDSKGLFNPRANITRAEFTAILVRALGIETSTATESFTDVNEGDWYQSVIATAVAHGLINGRSSTTFDPNAPITRSEMATITSNVLVKEYGYKAVSNIDNALNAFVDQADVVSAHRAGVALVAQEGIVQGKGLGVYDAKGTFTRAEAAVVVNKLLNLR